jgi:cupin superfamily acireductone dioxygenase involved in methionine salvage
MAKALRADDAATQWGRGRAYDHWVQSLGLPVHEGYHIEDLRAVALAWWEERRCHAAFLKLAGQEGISEVRIGEIPAGQSTAPWRMALDELVYAVDGRGLTTVWAEGKPKKTFEWQKHSLFRIPRNHYCQLSNAQGGKPARLLHYNSLPLAMTLLPDPEFFFSSARFDADIMYGDEGGFYSEAKFVPQSGAARRRSFWLGNFFPDMRAWDKLLPFKGRGAGGHAVWIRFPQSPLWNHMSVFPAQTYKKAHRHGPGTLVVIVAGEGYSFMWPEGREKVHVPWREGSAFVPPNMWFHQHFNLGAAPARYLAFHAPKGAINTSERIEDLARDQIDYADEDPMIRKQFVAELGKREVTSVMPEQAYKEKAFEWDYAEDE